MKFFGVFFSEMGQRGSEEGIQRQQKTIVLFGLFFFRVW